MNILKTAEKIVVSENHHHGIQAGDSSECGI